MQPDLDGRGEGFGRYKGLSVAETQALFDRCVADPSMRSISAILRITREQLDARGNLGIYPVLAWIAGSICGLSAVVRVAAPSGFHEMAIKVVIGSGCVFLLILGSTVPTMRSRKRNVTQEAALRDAAVLAIGEILKSKPPLKPLTIEQEFTVKLLLRKSPDSDALRVLLGS